jgi:catechol 2,3-dioxygenase-like lactoylglutathione lyase family enzyme
MCRIHWSRPSTTRRVGGKVLRLNGRTSSPRPRAISPSDAAAARAFYCDALRGRQVGLAPRRSTVGSLWFLVAGTIVEVRTDRGSAAAPIALDVDDPDLLAQRCWDAGFTVRVRQDEAGRAPVSVIDPFGRRVDLAPRAEQVGARLAAGGEES